MRARRFDTPPVLPAKRLRAAAALIGPAVPTHFTAHGSILVARRAGSHAAISPIALSSIVTTPTPSATRRVKSPASIECGERGLPALARGGFRWSSMRRTKMKITVQKNGPLRVEGDDIQIQDPNQQTYGLGGRTVVSLCRCGFSANKPFCDGSHNHHGFQDDPQARDLPPKKV